MGLAEKLGETASVKDPSKLWVGVVHNGTCTSRRWLCYAFAELGKLSVSMAVQI